MIAARRFILVVLLSALRSAAADGETASENGPTLRYWNRTATTQRILSFVEKVTNEKSGQFVKPSERIAVFDLDGTLLSEKPYYIASLIAEKRLREKLDAQPALLEEPLYRAVRGKDRNYLGRHYREAHLEAFKGWAQSDTVNYVRAFMARHRHPRFDRPYREMVYAPMRSLVDYLRAHAFRVYVVSTSPQEFIRAFAEEHLHVSRAHVIGSAVAFTFEPESDPPRFRRAGQWFEPYNAGAGKAVRIRERTGRRPILACGNGVGDVEMLRLTASGTGPRLVMVVDHDDPDRDAAYRNPYLLRVAEGEGWTIVSVKRDYAIVFPSPAR